MNHILKSLLIAAVLALCGAPCRAEYFVKLEPSDTEEQVMRKAASVTPHPRQIAWQREEYTAFIHFGMNTMTNREWGRGTEDPALFNPKKLDARQWVAVIKDAGMTQMILTAKHHDGFCLWPSAYTEHSVKNSPWKNGGGDVVREAADAARESGLKFGFYLSPWDRNSPLFGTPGYDTYYDNQLRELLTGYGPVHEVWMDGACGSAMDPDPRCQGVAYDWDTIFATVRELQPQAAMSIYGPDVRWIGNEAGENPDTQWSVLPVGTPAGDMVPGGRAHLMAAAKNGDTLRWYPAQADTSIRPGWFYHPGEDYLVKTNNQLFHIWFNTVGGNAQLLLNIPPGPDGLIHKNDIKALKSLRKRIDAIYDRNFVAGAQGEAAAIDGDQDTYWQGPEGAGEISLEYTLPAPAAFDIAMFQEHIASGQRIEAFALDAEINGRWTEIASGTTVGYKRFVQFEPVTASRVRIRFTQYRVAPTLAEFALFTMAPSAEK